MKNNIFNVLKKELRETYRDKKSLSMMFIIPLLIPLLVIGMSALFDAQMSKNENSYNRIGFNYQLGDIEKKIAKEMKIESMYGTTEELEKLYEEGKLDLYVTKKDNYYVMNGNDNENSTYASILAESYFEAYKSYLEDEYLTNNNVDTSEFNNLIIVKKDLKEEDNYFANYITNYAFLFIIMAITISATYPATDTTAGEKERGTLETLLTFPIRSKDIIIGKFLSVSLSSIMTGIISLILTIISLVIAGNNFEIYDGINMMLPFSSILFSIIVIIFYSFLISGLCIAIASKCKTFKEAQSALTPLTFISFFPGMIAFMIEVESSTILSLVPFLNFSLLFTDITNGSVEILNIFLMIISTIIIIAVVLEIIIKQYKSEKVLFNN